MSRSIAIDFDGVIHNYSKGWQDGVIYDEPVPGAKEALTELKKRGFEIIIYSMRCYPFTIPGKERDHQQEELKAYLTKYEIPFDKIHDQPGKPFCCLFIDDNAYRFTGDWQEAMEDLKPILFKHMRSM